MRKRLYNKSKIDNAELFSKLKGVCIRHVTK